MNQRILQNFALLSSLLSFALSACSPGSSISIQSTSIPETTIAFVDKGHKTEEGDFEVTFTQASKQYLKDVRFELNANGPFFEMYCVRKGDDFKVSDDGLTYTSNFRGTTLAIDGHQTYYEILREKEGLASIIIPLTINGELHSYYASRRYSEEGYRYAYEGIYRFDDTLRQKPISLKEGDEIQLYSGYSGQGIEVLNSSIVTTPLYRPGEQFTLKESGGILSEIGLPTGTYGYSIIAEDIFGKQISSEYTTFQVTEKDA